MHSRRQFCLIGQLGKHSRVRDIKMAGAIRFLFCAAFLSVDIHSAMGGPSMQNSLLELEAERSKILRQLTTLGDLRTGSICAVPRRCGKPTCHCAKPNDPGHDPQIRLTRRVDGNTVAESFTHPAPWRKAQSEIDEH